MSKTNKIFGDLQAKVLPIGRMRKRDKMSYRITCYLGHAFLTDYIRTGRVAAYNLKRTFESTGRLPNC
jgi:hypothetical protein